MSNDPKDPATGDDQQSETEAGEISAEDLKKVAGGRAMNQIYNVAGNLTTEAPTGRAPVSTDPIRKK